MGDDIDDTVKELVAKGNSHIQSQAVSKLVKKWTRAINLRGNYGCHTLRKTFGHPDKTHVGDCSVPGQGFEFLGYRFEAGKRWIREKSMKSLRDRIRTKTKRTCGKSIHQVIES